MKGITASSQLLRRGHSAVWSGTMLVGGYSEGAALPPACEITNLMMGAAPLTAQEMVTVEAREWLCWNMALSEGREDEHSGTGPSLLVADFIIDAPHGAGGGGWARGGIGDPINAGSLSSLHKINSFVPIAWDYKHEYPYFQFLPFKEGKP